MNVSNSSSTNVETMYLVLMNQNLMLVEDMVKTSLNVLQV